MTVYRKKMPNFQLPYLQPGHWFKYDLLLAGLWAVIAERAQQHLYAELLGLRNMIS